MRGKERWLALPRTRNEHAHDLPLPEMAEAAYQAALLISDPGSQYLFPGHHKPDQISRTSRRR